MENLLNTIFPPKCIFCDSVGELFCDHCLSSCDLLTEQRCLVCDKPSKSGYTHKECLTKVTPTQLICIFKYQDKVRDCIRLSKYSQMQFMALKKLSYEAICLALEAGLTFEDFVCVPIPISVYKWKTRGFNQSELIADILCKKFGLKKQSSILTRIKNTKSQHGLGKDERFKNVSGSFMANVQKARGKKILLVDDISTTGATFIEASKALYNVGAKEVRCFAVSKTLAKPSMK